MVEDERFGRDVDRMSVGRDARRRRKTIMVERLWRPYVGGHR